MNSLSGKELLQPGRAVLRNGLFDLVVHLVFH